MSLAVLPEPTRFPAMMVFRKFTVPLICSPPPTPDELPSESARLAVNVTLFSVRVLFEKMAPAFPVAEFPETVEFVSVIVPVLEITPPVAAVFPENVQLVAVTFEFTAITPPLPVAELFEKVEPERLNVPLPLITPPSVVAELPVTVEPVTVKLPFPPNTPPFVAELLLIVALVNDTELFMAATPAKPAVFDE